MNAADNLLYSSVLNASTSERGTIGKEDGKVAGPLYSVAPGIQAYAFDRLRVGCNAAQQIAYNPSPHCRYLSLQILNGVVYCNAYFPLLEYRINWFISPPYMARARQTTLSRGGLIAKGFTM